MRKFLLRRFSFAGVIAAIYAVTTISLGSLGYSWIQVRVSEALAPMPYLFGLPAVIGLSVGCIVSNLYSPAGIPDLVFGPMLTLIASILSWKFNFGKKLVACVYPVVVNAFGVSAYLAGFYGIPYVLSVLSIALGESIAAILLGYTLLRAMEKMPKSVLGEWQETC
jgi:uncharacterized membrane protein